MNTPTLNFMRLALTFLILLSVSEAFAARVVNFKGRKVLVNLEQTRASEGERYFAINAEGRKIGMIEIKKIKGTKALALLVKGKIEKGSFLEATAQGSTAMSAPIESSSPAQTMGSTTSKKMSFGGLFGISLNTINATGVPITGGTLNPKLSGTSMNFSGLMDYNLNHQFSLRGIAGLESLQATSEPEQGNTYGVDISYLSFSALGRYHLMDGRLKVWIGGGVNGLYAMSKTSNLVNVEKVGFSFIFPLAIGADFTINPKMYIPIQAEYNYWPSSGNISTTTMVVRGGFAMRF